MPEKYIARKKYALKFDGENDLVDVQHEGELTLQERVTFSLWWKVEEDTEDFQYAFRGGDDTNDYLLRVRDTYGSYEWVTFINGSLEFMRFGDPIDYEGEWIHMVVIHDYEEGRRAYINGELIAEDDVTGEIDEDFDGHFVIGAERLDGTKSTSGNIDDFRIYDEALSELEIQALYKGHEVKDGLVGHWKMNEGSGDTVYDSSGNENHGTIEGATWVGYPYKYLTKIV